MGQFQTQNGQIIDPNGNVFTARGITLNDGQMGAADQALADFPGLNFVRLSIYSYQNPSAYASFIQDMTSHGVVVEVEDHTTSTGSNNGGSAGSAFSGQQLSDEMNWYSSMASTYASNPYVWFGTDNEPPNAGLSSWEQQTYNAIRDTGNNNPIMMELPGGGYPGGQTVQSYGMDPNVYASMSNIVMDVHFYGWSSGFSTDQGTVDNTLSDLVNGAKTVPSADGTVPVIIGEYGVSTDGYNTDANASQVIQAVQSSNQISGAAAWSWDTGVNDSLTDGQGNLTWWGQQVEPWIASGASNASTSTAASSTVSASDTSAAANPGTNMQFINTSGNYVSLTGGNSSVTDNSGGNSFQLPIAGTGMADFATNIFDLPDALDLRYALSATDWNGDPGALSNYLSVANSSDGAVVSLASTSGGTGTPIADIAGAYNLDLNTLLWHSIT